jgi:hypothetical protein
MTETRTFGAADFKARCLEILDLLATRQLTRVLVTKRGKVVAVLTPPEVSEAEAAGLHGFMKGSVILPPGFDLTAPVLDEPLNADHGALFDEER